MAALKIRFWMLALLAAGTLAAPGAARAQMTMTATTLAKDDFLIRVQRRDGGNWVFMTDIEEKYFFNRARCECDEPINIRIDLANQGLSKQSLITQGELRLYIGTSGCLADDMPGRTSANCSLVEASSMELTGLFRAPYRVELATSMRKLFVERAAETPSANICTKQVNQSIWLYVDTTLDKLPDLTGSNAPQKALVIDGRAPSPPGDLKLTGGNEALDVQWTGTMGISDMLGYLVFCSRGQDAAVFSPAYSSKDYQSRGSLCPAKAIALTVDGPQILAATTSTSQSIAAPAQFQTLDPAYVCSDLLPTAHTSTRLSILENGIPYLVGVSAIDKSGNASPIQTAALGYPIPTRDFYRGYRADGGEAEGGFCAIAQNGRIPSAPESGALAAILVMAAAFARRRGRRP